MSSQDSSGVSIRSRNGVQDERLLCLQLLLASGMCHDPQCSGACWTYFPWPQTRHVDPRSILAEQCTTPDRPTKVGMQNTDAHIGVPSLLVHKCAYMYLTSTRSFPSLEI